MMNIEIQIPEKMINNGSTILRAMQNNNTPEADLFIRESIQNSLDAALETRNNVHVAFDIGEFSTKELSKELESIDKKIIAKYKTKEKFLCVRDYNTVGLTGSLSHDEITETSSYGNLLKLIYEIGKPQEKEGAGGSWGYGKTIFYRIGMGLVFYYSRIKISSGIYEERLAAVLVENEKKEDSIIPSYNNKISTGVAWWGKKVAENKTIPITDKKIIHEFLEIFDIERYKSSETGTAIIMPFINEQEILYNNAYGSEQGEDRIKYYDDLADYLVYSVQRWYFPRLNNPYYKFGTKTILNVSVNGEMIDYQSQEQYFKLLLDLYNYAHSGETKQLNFLKNADNIQKHPVNLNNTNKVSLNETEVGNIVFGMFSYEELEMGSPGQRGNPHFLSNLDQEENDLNEPIITYTRQPGMIINYEDRSVWTKNISKTSKESYLIGIFVLNSDNTLIIDDTEATLEEYVRQGERADHTSWHDHSNLGVNPTIVQRIQNNIVNKIRNEYDEKVEKLETDNDGRLAKILGESILPPSGFGTKASKRKITAKSNNQFSKSKQIESKLMLDNIVFAPNKIEIPFGITILNKSVIGIEFEIQIDTENSSLTIPRYEKEISRESPFKIVNLEMFGNKSFYSFSNEENDFSTNTSDLGTVYGLAADNEFSKDEYLSGHITIETQALDVRPLVKIKGKVNTDVND